MDTDDALFHVHSRQRSMKPGEDINYNSKLQPVEKKLFDFQNVKSVERKLHCRFSMTSQRVRIYGAGGAEL